MKVLDISAISIVRYTLGIVIAIEEIGFDSLVFVKRIQKSKIFHNKLLSLRPFFVQSFKLKFENRFSENPKGDHGHLLSQ